MRSMLIASPLFSVQTELPSERAFHLSSNCTALPLAFIQAGRAYSWQLGLPHPVSSGGGPRLQVRHLWRD